MQDEPIVIVDAEGTEHEFPPGMDPKKAADIVRYRTSPTPDRREPHSTLSDEPLEPSLFSKVANNPLLKGAAEPHDVGDFMSLIIPSGMGEAISTAKDYGRIIKNAASESPTLKGIPGRILSNIRERPKSLQDFQARGFNDLPLAEQMDHLPEVKSPILSRGGGPPTIQGDINDLPLASQMDHLPTEGGTGSVRGGGLPVGEQSKFNDLPLHRQQTILDASTPAREAPITSRGPSSPRWRDTAQVDAEVVQEPQWPSRGAADAEFTDVTPAAPEQAQPLGLPEAGSTQLGPSNMLDDLPSRTPDMTLEERMNQMVDEAQTPPESTSVPQGPEQATEPESVIDYTSPQEEPDPNLMLDETGGDSMPLGKPRVTAWKSGHGPSDELIGQLRDEAGSKDAARRLAIPQAQVKERAPRMSPASLPPEATRRIEAAMEGMTPEEKLVYLESAPNGLSENFIQSLLKR